MRNARRLLAALLAVVMLIPSILVPGYAAETTGFKDVREDSWYANAVDYVSAAGYMKGTSKDAFSPGEDVTRAMFVTILSRVARAQTDNTVSAFGDVAANQYYSGAIEWAAEKEIVNGVGGGLFAPYRSITRQDLAVMLYRFVNAMGYELSAGESRTYTDEAAISAYAADAVRFVTSTGLFAGYQDGSFRPKATATRAQTAVIVMRLAQLLDGQIVDPEPMPAQSFDQTSEQMQVSVNAPEGALPENTKMTVSRVTDEAALAELASKVGAEVLGAADISFAKDGAELEPARKVSVRISLDALQSAKNPAVVHVKDDGSFEYVSSSVVTTRGKADAIEFEADSFSVYAVTDSQTNATLTISFYAREHGSEGAWKIVNKQILRADQLGTGKSAIADPGVPNITTSQAFEGWMIEEENVPFNPSFTYNADTTKYSVKQINDYCNENPPSGADKEVVLYAAVYDVVYVTYHDQAGAVTFAEYHKIPAGSNSVSVTITEDYPPMKSNQNFSGWVKEDDVAVPGDVDGTLPTYLEGAGARKWPLDSIQNISENVDLYPYVEEGYWLSFNNNIAKNSQKLGFEDDTSAEYISPIFIPKGTTPTQPAFPSNDPRHGYTFAGWYEDADMKTAFNFNQQLTEDTTVYAKWDFATTSYRVIYWKQRATDEYTYTDEQKNYDYFDSRTVSGAATGSTVGISNSGTNNDTTVNVAQNNENNFYFRFNSSKSDKTVADGSTVRVKGDGTTVLNVYYDRKTITYNFGPAELHYYPTTPDWNKSPFYYAQTTGGDYVEVYRVPSGGSYVYYVKYTGTLDISYSGSYYLLMNSSFYPLYYDSTYGWYISDGSSYYYPSESDNGKVYTLYTSAPTWTWYEPRYEMGSATYTHSNLYGHQYKESDWPSAGSGYTWACNDISDGEVYQFPLALTEYVPTWRNLSNPTDSYLTMNFYVSEYYTNTIPVKYVGASLTNSSLYNVALTSGTASKPGTWYPTETVEGFTVTGYAFLSDAPTAYTTWTPCTNTSEIPVGANETGTLYVAFSRNNYTLTYSSTNNVGTQTEDVTIPYEKSLTSYKSHTPSNSYPGYYFAGWYLDEEGTQSFDPENMPAHNIIVYAKWNPKWYRIVVDYKRGNSSSVITVPGSTQKASFTVQYGSTIQTSSLMQAQRVDLDDGNDNWMLVGLYLDEACTKPFNRNMRVPFGLTEAEEVYPPDSRTGIDDITGETWSDEAYPDVRAKITLYAKWRVNPEGVVGIKVRYLGDHAENDKGYFDSNEKPHSMTLQNPVFTDGAKASAHSATVPALPDEDTPDVGRRFLYWEILDKYGNSTGEIVYPGSPFTIDINKAVEIKTPLPDPNGTHTNEGASTIASVAAVAPTCTGTGGNAVTQPNLSSGKADSSANLINLSANANAIPNPNPLGAGDVWVPTNTIDTSKDYLIGISDGSNVYLLANHNGSNNYYTFNSNYRYLYTGTATLDGNNVIGVTGAQTSLNNCKWKFGSSTGGVITNQINTRYKLRFATSGASSDTITFYQLYQSYYSSSTTYDSSSNTIRFGDYYLGLVSINGVDYGCVLDSQPTTSVILYTKATNYTVTVASGITNGTVFANKSTATAGETVRLTLTPSEGYQVASVTVTDSNGATVPVTGTNGSVTFTMPASNVTVSATFTNVIPDDVWVVSFVDEDGKDIPGMNDIYVPKGSRTLNESDLPDPAKEEHYFLGWYQGNVKCTFPMTVNSDIVLTPKYSPMYAYDYTLTLRAVYGPYNPDATTHIYWYANNGTDAHNGAGERYTSKYTVTEGGMTTTTTKLPINAQVDIPLPTGNAASQTVFVGDKGGALTWEDHVFLGWARVDNGGTAEYAEAQILTPDDIYLKWTGTEYEVRNDDGTYSPFSSQKVYADETTPYHDMYAVWAGFYYIYHSSDGTLEAVQVPFDDSETKDLVAEVKTNYLYGGYYKTSGAVVSVDANEMRAAKDSILNAPNFWNYTDSCVAFGSVTETSLTEEGAVVYNGTSIKHTVDNVTVPFWQKAQAYTELGTELAPTAGTVYYLKEVPTSFLPNRLVYVKADKNTQLYDGTPIEEGKLTSLYLLTALDDRNYADNGFFVGDASDGQNVTSLNGKSGSADSVSRVFTIFVKNGETYSYNANALNDSIVVPEGMNPNLVGFVAAKHLDYDWIQAHRGQTEGAATFYLKPYWTTLDGVTVTQNIKGVNITADGKGISFVNVQ